MDLETLPWTLDQTFLWLLNGHYYKGYNGLQNKAIHGYYTVHNGLKANALHGHYYIGYSSSCLEPNQAMSITMLKMRELKQDLFMVTIMVDITYPGSDLSMEIVILDILDPGPD